MLGWAAGGRGVAGGRHAACALSAWVGVTVDAPATSCIDGLFDESSWPKCLGCSLILWLYLMDR